MDLHSEPAYHEIQVLDLDVAVIGEVRQLTLFEDDEFTVDAIREHILMVVLKARAANPPFPARISERIVFPLRNVLWFASRPRTMRIPIPRTHPTDNPTSTPPTAPPEQPSLPFEDRTNSRSSE